jgi:hypothetical protein
MEGEFSKPWYALRPSALLSVGCAIAAGYSLDWVIMSLENMHEAHPIPQLAGLLTCALLRCLPSSGGSATPGGGRHLQGRQWQQNVDCCLF